MERGIILNRLLDKYESSKHLLQPGRSNRRVMLRMEKKELPEYHYQDARIRDAFHDAAIQLERKGLVSLEWFPGRPVLRIIALNLERIDQSYELLGRVQPRELASLVCEEIEQALSEAQTPWICAWRDDIVTQARNRFSVPAYSKND